MILACPACDSRYDVTGHASGERLRCRCGVVMTLAAPPAIADELDCPHCGANVAATSSSCEHCGIALLVKSCPRCLSRVFHGHKHCPACGAELVLAATDVERAGEPHVCPRCSAALQARRIDDIVIEECGNCLGVFLDHVAIKRVIVDRAQSRAEALLGALPRTEVHPVPGAGQKMYLPCPVCHVVMNRRLFAAGTGVIIDVCRTHGTFFDAGELPVIVEFVMNGGLEHRNRKDVERMTDARPEPLQVLPTTLPVARVHHDAHARTSKHGALFAVLELLLDVFD